MSSWSTSAPLVDRLHGTGALDGWFSSATPTPSRTCGCACNGDTTVTQPAVLECATGAVADGLLWRVGIDTYRPEVDRYGGPAAMPLCEQIFEADSDAVIALLTDLPPAEDRWRLAIAGLRALVDDSGLPADEVIAALRVGPLYRPQWRTAVGERWRAERDALAAMLAGPAAGPLLARSERIRPRLDALRRLDGQGRLTRPLTDILGSLAHLHVNRLLRSAQSAQEAVLRSCTVSRASRPGR